jgi:hypothetical protein
MILFGSTAMPDSPRTIIELSDTFTPRHTVLSTALDALTATDPIKSAHGSPAASKSVFRIMAHNRAHAGCLCLTKRSELVFCKAHQSRKEIRP